MPSCIMKTLDSTSVLSPGLMTIEPMVSLGGQHPSSTSMYGIPLKRNTPSFLPTLNKRSHVFSSMQESRQIRLNLLPAQPQAVRHHKDTAKSHRASRKHRVQISKRSGRDQHHVIDKCPEQILLDRRNRLA